MWIKRQGFKGFTLYIAGLLSVMLGFGPLIPAYATGGDFSLNFVAAGPGSYDHETGIGGAFGDGSIDRNTGVVESLEGGDFTCGDKVVFFLEIAVQPSAVTQTVEVDFSFLAEPTGQRGVGFTDLLSASLNIGDSGNSGLEGNETVTVVSETLDTEAPPSKDTLFATVQITNLDGGDVFILRLTALLGCEPGSTPTGNLQADVQGARVTSPSSESGTIRVGGQTIPFKKVEGVHQTTLPTTPVPASGEIGAVSLNDSALLSGGSSPTGTITFYLYDPTSPTCVLGTERFTQVVTVSGNGTYTTTGGPVADMVGTWRWTAVYSGDSQNGTSVSGCDAELVTITRAQPDITTIQQPVTATVGSSIYDTASVSGGYNPTGTVSFNLYGPGDTTCATSIFSSPNVAIVGSGYTSGSYTPTTTGVYRWTATYNGNTNNLPATSGCADEPVTVVDARIVLTPPNATNEVNASHTVTATVEWDSGSGWTSSPNGTPVTFTLTSNTSGATFVNGTDTCSTTSGSCTITINSSDTGSVDIHATTTFDVAGLSVTRSSDGAGLNSVDAQKLYVDGRLVLSPLNASNEVGDDHVITATAQQKSGTDWQSVPDGTVVAFSLLNNAANATFVSDDECITVAGLCTVTITSTEAGGVDIHATTTFDVAGITLIRTTGSGAPNSADARKTYVDARIFLSPASATNEVNDEHVITATIDRKTGSNWVDAPDGTLVTFTLLSNSANASFVGGNTCRTVDGECSVTITSSEAGGVDIHATTTFDVRGISLTRSTGSGLPNGSDAHKDYVDAQMTLSPLTATNQVGETHTVTATVRSNTGGAWNPVSGVTVTFTLLSNSAGATFIGGSTCLTTASGSCQIQIISNSAGGVDIHATSTFDVSGISVTRSSGTGAPNSADAQKDYVDARIRLTPVTATNEIDEQHVITATVDQKTGANWVDAPDGTLVTFSLLNNTTNASFLGGNTCVITSGSCAVTIVSALPGGVDIHATTTFAVQGLSVTRATGTGLPNSSDAHKDYVDARMTLTPLTATNEVGEAHTVTATVEQNTAGAWTSVSGVTVNFTLLNNSAGATFIGGSTCLTTASGSCQIQIISNSAGGVDIRATSTFDVSGISVTRSSGTGAPNSADAYKDYVDGSIAIGQDAVNLPGEPHTFLITATAHPSGASPVAFDDITPSVSPIPDGGTSTTCDTPTVTNGGMTATCTFTITNTVAGSFTADAQTNISMGTVTVFRSTSANSGPAGTGGAIKDFISILIVKGGPLLAHVGDTITYSMTVTNPSDVPLENVVVSDPRCDGAPVFRGGDIDNDNKLDPSETWLYSCTHLIAATDPDPLPNTATVRGSSGGRIATSEDSHLVDLIHPAITLTKTASPTTGLEGDRLVYTYVVTNTGDTTLFDVSVDDDKLGHIGDIASLAPGASATLTFATVFGDTAVTNIGTASGFDILRKRVSDTDDETVIPTAVRGVTFTRALGAGLAQTGIETPAALALGVVLLIAGGVALGSERVRMQKQAVREDGRPVAGAFGSRRGQPR